MFQPGRRRQVRDGLIQEPVVANLQQRMAQGIAQQTRFRVKAHRLAIGDDGFGGLAILKQDLPFQFMEIGVVLLLRDQAVGDGQRLAHIAALIQRDGAGITRGDGIIGR